jgi:hypothetical protein
MKDFPNFSAASLGKINCVTCWKMNVIGCESCKRCPGCRCQCWVCGFCKIKHPPKLRCKICRGCKKKCGCRSMPSGMKIDAPKGLSFVNKLPRSLGLELEMVPFGQLDGVEIGFNVVRDGSITPGGQELVLDPLIGDGFLTGITSLAEKLANGGFGIDPTCGFHVHVGAKDAGAFELRRLLNVYKVIERGIYKLHPGRDAMRFCKPFEMAPRWYEGLNGLKTNGDIKRYLLRWLYGTGIVEWERYTGKPANPSKPPGLFGTLEKRRHKYEERRYHGLNIHSWMQRGTIEWRHAAGTIELEELIFWPLTCGWLTEIAMGLRDEEAKEIKCLSDLVNGSWKRPYALLEIPKVVRDWINSRMGI